MALFRYPKSKVWWYEFRFAGARIRESSKSQSKAVAKEAERVRRRQLEESYNGISAKKMPLLVSDAASDFLARKLGKVKDKSYLLYKLCLEKHIVPFFGKMLVTAVTHEDLKEYQQKRLSEGAAPKTINLEIEPLRNILMRYKVWHGIRYDFSMLRTPESPGIALSHAQEEAPRLPFWRPLWDGQLQLLSRWQSATDIWKNHMQMRFQPSTILLNPRPMAALGEDGLKCLHRRGHLLIG